MPNGFQSSRMKGSEIASTIKRYCYCGAGAPVPEKGFKGEIATGTPAVIAGQQVMEGAEIIVLSAGTGKPVRFGNRNIAIGSVVYDSRTGKTQVVRNGPEQETARPFSLLRWSR